MTARRQGGGKLEEAIHRLLEDPEFTHAFWGIHIETADGEVLYEHNASKALWPAQLMMLPTVAHILCQFGHDFKFDTAFCISGEVRGDTLEGDLVIVGQGDPTCGTAKDPLSELAAMAKSIKKELGIRRINGRVATSAGVAACNEWFLGDLDSPDFRVCSPVSSGENVRRVVVRPGKKVGDWATIQDEEADDLDGPMLGMVGTTEPKGQKNVYFAYAMGLSQWILAGNIPLGAPPHHIEVPDNHPANLTARRFEQCLKKEGVAVMSPKNAPRQFFAKDKLAPIMGTSAAPLSTLARICLESKDEFYADQFFLATAMLQGREWSFYDASETAEEWLTSIGLPDIGALRHRDGSGRARTSAMTPRAMTALLRYMKSQGKEGEVFFKSIAPPSSESDSFAYLVHPLTNMPGVSAMMTFVDDAWGLAGVASPASNAATGAKEVFFCLLANGPSGDLMPDEDVLRQIVQIFQETETPD